MFSTKPSTGTPTPVPAASQMTMTAVFMVTRHPTGGWGCLTLLEIGVVLTL